jgi:uncharacterized protein YdhG (YjbR/CyaY superfamily)
MASQAYASVDEYLAAQPDQHLPKLLEAREAIRSALPEAEESIAYNIPAYKINGKAVLFLAGWKNHFSIYPASDALVAALGEKFAPAKVVKRTLQFSYKNPVPADLLRKIAELRAVEVSAK